MALRCEHCGRQFKSARGLGQHHETEIAYYRKGLDFWKDYNRARDDGYRGMDDEYARGVVLGYLDILGRPRGQEDTEKGQSP